MGEMIASSVVSAVDDGLLENTWGSINIDDEGLPTQRTQLIKDGKLTSFIGAGSMKTGYDPIERTLRHISLPLLRACGTHS